MSIGHFFFFFLYSNNPKSFIEKIFLEEIFELNGYKSTYKNSKAILMLQMVSIKPSILTA